MSYHWSRALREAARAVVAGGELPPITPREPPQAGRPPSVDGIGISVDHATDHIIKTMARFSSIDPDELVYMTRLVRSWLGTIVVEERSRCVQVARRYYDPMGISGEKCDCSRLVSSRIAVMIEEQR